VKPEISNTDASKMTGRTRTGGCGRKRRVEGKRRENERRKGDKRRGGGKEGKKTDEGKIEEKM